MSHAYGLGIEHALYALTWAAGVLTVVAGITLAILPALWTGRRIPAKVRLIRTTRRLHREASRSGRA